MKILQLIGASLVGLIAGAGTVFAIEYVSILAHPMPQGLDINDKEKAAAWIEALPISAFLFVIAAWSGGSFFGPYVARRVAPGRSAWSGLFVWFLLTIATVMTLFSIPYPTWVWVVGLLVCLVFGLLGLVCGGPKDQVENNFGV
jgi:hypothetical protein